MPHDIEAAVTPAEPVASVPLATPSNTRIAQINVVLACLVGNIITPILVVRASLGLFLIPISQEFRWPREEVSAVFSLLSVFSALSYPIVGKLADSFGPRRLILIGNIGAGAGVIAVGSATPNVVLFYGLFALIGIFASLASTMMYNRVVSGWFDKTRGTMLGVTAGLGNGAGSAFIPFAALILMRAWGWRGACFGLGTTMIVVGVPVMLLLLKEPPLASCGHAPLASDLTGMTLSQAARTSSFWLTLTAIGLGAGCLTAVFAHIVPILSDRHFPYNQGILVVSVFGMVGAGWMMVTGWLLDRIPSPKMIAPLYLLSVVGTVALEHATTLPMLVASGVLMGIGLGTEFGALSYFISRYFGLRQFATIAGIMYFAVTIAQGISPYLMDVDFDHNRSYVLSLHIVDTILVVGAALIICLPRYRATTELWKRHVD
jgi:MFS family permease